MAVETKYGRDTNRYNCEGLDLNRPVDSVKKNKFPYLKNCRSYVSGRIEPRSGLVDLAQVVAGQSPVHSARRLNDPLSSTYTRVVGAGTHLAYGQGAFTDLDSGYSGDPLALVPWKPDVSPTPYMYVADRSRMRKVNASGTLDTIGYAAPANSPGVVLTNAPSYKVIDELNVTTGWAAAGTAGAASTTTRINTTITYILYDSGSTGWCSIAPASMANIGESCRIIVDTGGAPETIVVQTVHPGSVASTIASIIYDSGTTGLCSIVLTTAIDQATCDALIRNTTQSENVRIVAITTGPDGSTSLRLSTTGTWVATDGIQVIPSFRTYATATHAAAQTLTRDALRTAVTVGTGTLTKTAALDLSLLAAGIPTHPDDLMHIGIRVSDPSVITELKILLDVDSAGAGDAAVFTRNYYWRSFRANDLTPAAANLQSLLATRQQILQRTIIDTPVSGPDLSTQGLGALDLGGLSPEQFAAQQNQAQSQLASEAQLELPAIDAAISQQLEAGVSQFVELRFRLADLIRVGTDTSRTLQNVDAIRIVAIVTGNVNVDLSDWYISGGYGPDTSDSTSLPYHYRYRVRNPATNVASNFSPATRYDATPLRQSVTVTPAQYAAPSGTSLTTASFVIDVQRFGGQIAAWTYIGTIPNAASPSFADIYDDLTVAKNPIQGNDSYQLWPILGVPVTGTTGTVSGTTINDAATNFSLLWAPGTRILVNSQPYTIYRVISTSRLELVENATSQSAVTWRIDEPTILAQSLPCLWEWGNTFFACGDPVNPGRLYYSNPNTETAKSTNYLDMTSPSEPLMNGVRYNVRAFVFSSENFFQILQTNNPDEPYTYQVIPNGKGMFSRWFINREPSPFIAFGSKDGIYLTMGGSPVSLTDEDMYPLFPNEGNPGVNTNGVSAPVITAANATQLRLCYYDSYLYFDYATANGVATLMLDFTADGSNPNGWFWDVYTPNIGFHYGEEGAGVHALLCGGGTHLYQYTGDSDNGTAISMEITTPSRDQDSPRENKRYGDIMLDADTDGLNVTCTPYVNNNATAMTPTTVNTASRLQTAVPMGSVWQVARNVSLATVVLVSGTARPLFYIWEPRWTFESAPISALSWEISPTSFGVDNFKSVGICKVTHVSTSDIQLVFTVDRIVQTAIVIPNSSGLYEQKIFRVPVYKGKIYSISMSSGKEWRLDTRDSFFDIKEWANDGPFRRVKVFSDYSMIENNE